MPGMMDTPAQSGLPFMKMHGAGNDFVVIDSRGRGAGCGPSGWRMAGLR